MFGDYIVAFDSNLTDVVQFTGVAILVLGFSNFIWYALGILNMEFLLTIVGFPSRPALGDDRC
jgi:hypothetical protein